MRFGKLSALVTVLALGIGSLGIANASPAMFHQDSTTPVLTQNQAAPATPGKAGHVKAISAAKSSVIISADEVTITPVAEPQEMKNQPAVNNNMSDSMFTNNYVYMYAHMANMGQHMGTSAAGMKQHMESGMGQHMESGMGQHMNSDMGQHMGSGIGQNMGSGMM